MSYIAPEFPMNAPFSPPQQAWLNGLLAGLLAPEDFAAAVSAVVAVTTDKAAAPQAPGWSVSAPAPDQSPTEHETFPWHDPALSLDDRLALAEGRPLARRLMAAMAQLDCGQCGYLCQSYAEAIARGEEKSLSRCVPGGKETSRTLKEISSGPREEIGSLATPLPAVAVAPIDANPMNVGGTTLARFEAAIRLNGEGSEKDTRHVIFQFDDRPPAFKVGDALGVHVTNEPEVVDAIVERLGAPRTLEVECPDGSQRPLGAALLEVCDIGQPSDQAIEVLASRARDHDEADRLQALAEGYPGAEPADADLLDLLLTFPSSQPPIQELISALGSLQPRLYSIASSPKALEQQVHLTVAAVRYEKRGRLRKGVASTFLAERAEQGAAVPVFIQSAPSFGLPDDPDSPVIMIGPGTGIAPFRAFLQDRRAVGARGRNWLFFGDRQCRCDFLYEEELDIYRRDGLLTRLDIAFSRDQPEKLYVQHRMRERQAELWAWLQEGAHIYVCGDAGRMARDVDAALAHIIARQGGMELAAAKKHLAALARDGRYQRDVY